MRVLIALDLNDEDLAEAYDGAPVDADDLRLGLRARLGYDGTGEAIYCGRGDMPIRGQMLSAQDVTGALDMVLSAAEVGAEGMAEAYPEDQDLADKAWTAVREMARQVAETRV